MLEHEEKLWDIVQGGTLNMRLRALDARLEIRNSVESFDSKESQDYNFKDYIELLLEDSSDSLCMDEFCCTEVEDTQSRDKTSCISNSAYYNDYRTELSSGPVALEENIRKIWCETEGDTSLSCRFSERKSEMPPDNDRELRTNEEPSRIRDERDLLRTGNIYERYKKLFLCLEKNHFASSPGSEDLNIMQPTNDFASILDSLKLQDTYEFVEENDREVERKRHKVSMKNIMEEIIKITMEAEGPPDDDSKQILEIAWDDAIEFFHKFEYSDDHYNDLVGEDICDAKKCPKGIRQPVQTSSEYLNKLNHIVHFFHGFSSAYQNQSSRCYYMPRKQREELLSHWAVNVPCSNWCNYNLESHIFSSVLHPDYPLGTQSKAPDSSEFVNCCTGEQEKIAESEFVLPEWFQDEPNTYSNLSIQHFSTELLRNENLCKTFLSKFSHNSCHEVTPSPVEEFFKSLYLPGDVLSNISLAEYKDKTKLGGSVESIHCSSDCSDFTSDSQKGSTSSFPEFLSLTGFISDSSEISFWNSDNELDTDIWGDKGEENYWKPLLACPAPVDGDVEAVREHSSTTTASSTARSTLASTRRVNRRRVVSSRDGLAVSKNSRFQLLETSTDPLTSASYRQTSLPKSFV